MEALLGWINGNKKPEDILRLILNDAIKEAKDKDDSRVEAYGAILDLEANKLDDVRGYLDKQYEGAKHD